MCAIDKFDCVSSLGSIVYATLRKSKLCQILGNNFLIHYTDLNLKYLFESFCYGSHLKFKTRALFLEWWTAIFRETFLIAPNYFSYSSRNFEFFHCNFWLKFKCFEVTCIEWFLIAYVYSDFLTTSFDKKIFFRYMIYKKHFFTLLDVIGPLEPIKENSQLKVR